MNPEWRSRYEAAVDAARKAGRLALRYFDTDVRVEWKQDLTPVTAADREAEAQLRAALLGAFPQDGFLGEESGDTPGSSGFRWVIDPVDGTRSFVRGIPLWATLVGLEYRGEQIAGVADVPALGQTYRALRGDGAYRDERRIRVSDVSDLGQAQIFYSSLSWFIKAGRRDDFLRLVERTHRQRGFGDFYGFVLVAQGSGELMVEQGCHAWDLAALKVIVEEAGGRFTDWDGGSDIFRPDVIASNGRLHEVARGLLRGAGGDGAAAPERYNARENNLPGGERRANTAMKDELAVEDVILETGNGPRIKGTRVTVYDVYYYMLLGRHHTYIAGMLSLSSAEVLAVMKYIEQHREEVHAVHQKIEERNARGNSPEVRAKLEASRAKFRAMWGDRLRGLNLEDGGEGDPDGH
jgi:histidinol-phosphatase